MKIDETRQGEFTYARNDRGMVLHYVTDGENPNKTLCNHTVYYGQWAGGWTRIKSDLDIETTAYWLYANVCSYCLRASQNGLS